MKRHKSPCISVCEFSGPNGWCLGCGRTRLECQKWKKMKPYEKTSEDPAIAVIFALNSPPVQLSAVISLIFLFKQAYKSFLDNFLDCCI